MSVFNNKMYLKKYLKRIEYARCIFTLNWNIFLRSVLSFVTFLSNCFVFDFKYILLKYFAHPCLAYATIQRHHLLWRSDGRTAYCPAVLMIVDERTVPGSRGSVGCVQSDLGKHADTTVTHHSCNYGSQETSRNRERTSSAQFSVFPALSAVRFARVANSIGNLLKALPAWEDSFKIFLLYVGQVNIFLSTIYYKCMGNEEGAPGGSGIFSLARCCVKLIVSGARAI